MKYQTFKNCYEDSTLGESEKKIYEYLSNMNISTITHEHEAVNTVED